MIPLHGLPCAACRVSGPFRGPRCLCSLRSFIALVLASLCSLPSTLVAFDIRGGHTISSSSRPVMKGSPLGHACSWVLGTLLGPSLERRVAGSSTRLAFSSRWEGSCGSASAMTASSRVGDLKGGDGGAWQRLIPHRSSVLIVGDANLSFSLVGPTPHRHGHGLMPVAETPYPTAPTLRYPSPLPRP